MFVRFCNEAYFWGANMNIAQKHGNVAQKHHGLSVQSQFHSVRGTARKGDIKFDHKMMKVLGFSNLDVLPETKTFDDWAHDPWTIVGVTEQI